MSRAKPNQNLNRILSRVQNSMGGKYYLYSGEKMNWFQVIFKLEKTLIPIIFPWVILSTAYGFAISLIYHYKFPILLPDNSITVNGVLSFNIALTLLLVFRTNTAHERFWEGRKLWGSLVNTVRNLARDTWIVVKDHSPDDLVAKEEILRLMVAFAVAMKLHLRSEPVNEEFVSLISETKYLQLKESEHPPLQIAFWIGDYLQEQHDRNCLNIYQLTTLHKLVDDLVDILGGCERILKTPLPLIYSIIFRQVVLAFCLILPFDLVSDVTWWTGIIMAFVSFTLLGIEEIGSEIEEPFGHDPNDLPLDGICNTILRNIEELIRVAPRSL